MKLGQAGAYVLTKEKEHKPTIIVGCDTRISGGMLANALMAGICSVGANAIYVGVAPTPAIAYLTRKHKVDAGVVISASHNPMEFNGIKFFSNNGMKIPDSLEEEIEEVMENGKLENNHFVGYRLKENKEPCIYVQYYERFMSEDTIFLGDFFENKKFHGKGYGKKIYSILESEWKKLGFNKIVLNVDLKNTAAILFWIKMGFKNAGKKTLLYIIKQN